jgi:predicted PolB exonuclease-like 3'-5' exonuclease
MVLDIETVSTRNRELRLRVMNDAIEKRPAQNTLKELKVQWDTDEAKEARALEALDKTAVDPLLAEPIVCCFRADGAGCALELYKLEKAELVALREVLNDMTGAETIWIGHNVKGFDLPVLLNTWRRHGIAPPDHFPRFRGNRWCGRIYDTMENAPTKTPFESLDGLCQAYGLGSAKCFKTPHGVPMNGGMVGEMYDGGCYAEITAYCETDVEMEEKLYMAMTFEDTWGCFDEESDIVEAIANLQSDESLTDTQKKLHIYTILEKAGRIPWSGRGVAA